MAETNPFGSRVTEARVAAGFSPSKLARLLGTTQQAVANYEKRNDGVAMDKLFALSDALGVSARWLAIGEKDAHGQDLMIVLPQTKLDRIAHHLAALPDTKLDALAVVLGIKL